MRTKDELTFGRYRVVSDRTYRGHTPGTEFVARLSRATTTRAIRRGDIVFLRAVRPGLMPGSYSFPHGWLPADLQTTQGKEQ